jgi:hypothetical protein
VYLPPPREHPASAWVRSAAGPATLRSPQSLPMWTWHQAPFPVVPAAFPVSLPSASCALLLLVSKCLLIFRW